MFKTCNFAMVLAMGLFGYSNLVLGDTITYIANGDFVSSTGGDEIGLNGASFSFVVEFGIDDTYGDLFGSPAVAADSNLITIEGASVASTNGSFSETFGLNFFPTSEGQFFGGADGGSSAVFDINGTDLSIFQLVNSVVGVSVGDLIDASHFGTEVLDNVPNFTTSSGIYNVENFSAVVEVKTIPEPNALAVFGALALVFYKPRRRT